MARRELLSGFTAVPGTARRVRTVRLHPGATRAVAACAAGERLISGWHAIAFDTSKPPTAALIRSVSATRSIRGNSVVVQAKAGGAVQAVRALLQVGAVCGGGS